MFGGGGVSVRMEEEEDEVGWCSSDSGDGDGDDDIEERKSQNVDALLRGNLVVKRQSLLPRLLSVSQGAAVCRKPFKPPCSKSHASASAYNQDLTRKLSARKRFVPWGSSSPIPIPIPRSALDDSKFNVAVAVADVAEELKPSLPPGIDPLVLWHPQDSEDANANFTTITVDPLLVRYLRPHQRRTGVPLFSFLHSLGKTLQSITLLYTLLSQGFDGKPMVRKAIIVTPTSLVSNWEAEIKKWVGERVPLVALCESTREDVISGIDNFTSPKSNLQVLIVSYETFRMHSSKFSSTDSCDLLICDEAHRLKNDQTITNRNDLEEFFAMVNFTNPGILGDIAHFRRYYEAPIICGREPAATAEEKKLGAEQSAELSVNVNRVKRAITEELKQSKILAYITALKKLCNHPKLIYDTIRSGSPGTSGFEDCIRFFPPEMLSGRSGSWTGGHGAWVELSGKMHVLARLLAHLRQGTNDRIVLVSNYTQAHDWVMCRAAELDTVEDRQTVVATCIETLDLFAQLCRERRYPHLRLDGSTSISKRQKLVNCFNDPSKDEFVFLLSSKAGGCGLNLIGGNRLVLFDPDWNPANDKQVYQRQMSKEGLQKVIQQEQTDSLVAQVKIAASPMSEIHENMQCSRCQTFDGPRSTEAQSTITDSESDEETSDIGGFAEIAGCLQNLKRSEKQVGSPLEEDLGSWGHHFFPTSVPDAILQASAGDEVTFVFTNQVNGRLVPVESIMSPKLQQKDPKKELLKSKQNGKQKPTPFSLHNRLPLQSASVGITKNISMNVAFKPQYSLVSKVLPQKRSCPANINDDN
ncbi:hypothetical protein JHK87_002761 [Glycine soja]|nr:hypothetical protein JHK87_002761 [Glycine soja]